MIPRKLHHIWVGPRPLPEAWADAWRLKHPGWEHRVWRETDLERIPMPNRAAYDDFMDRGVWNGASDIARVAILLAEGGVYVDIDSKPLLTFEGAPFMDASFFAGYEPVPSLPGRVAAGCIGAVAGHDILETFAELVGKMPSLAEPWDTCSGTGLTAAILVHRQCCKPLVLPQRTFYATDAQGRPTPGREVAYSEHFWATTNHSYAGRTVILVPRRADGGRRDRLWEFTREWWSRLGWPIFEGHHDAGPFNAAAARNEAARLAGAWDTAVFVDADTIVYDFEPVRQGVAHASRTGQFTRPYRTYIMLDEEGADHILATGKPWRGRTRTLRAGAHGGVNIVPRQLWDELGGYDERFVGWGGEDAAIEAAGRVLGGFAQLGGEVIHLWHPLSDDRNTSLPGFQANVALRERYERAARPSQIRALLAERDGREPDPPEVAAVVITNGRRDCIARTIPSLEAQVGPFTERLICDDSGDSEYAAWLRETFPNWTVAAHPHLGHAGAVAFAIERAADLRSEWVFWCEDDYEFQRKIDVPAIVATMDAVGDDLKQMSISRQAWFPLEVETGGMLGWYDQSLFTERQGPAGPWVEHRQFYTLNPHLVRRALLKVIRWPQTPTYSEHAFSTRLFRNPLPRCGIWGAKGDEPWAIHFGERVGTGY